MESNGRKAIVQGDFHPSNKDAKALIDRDLEDWDVLYIEGREPIYNLSGSNFGFAYYAIGAISTRSIIRGVHWFKQKFRLESKGLLDDLPIDKNNRIDAQHREIWGYTNKLLRWLLLASTALISAYTLKNPQFLQDINSTYFGIWHSILLFFPTLPASVHILSVVNLTNSRKRNDQMAKNIHQHATNNGHNKALILVGEMHRAEVSTLLREKGWNVDSEPSNSQIGKPIFKLYSFIVDWGE